MPPQDLFNRADDLRRQGTPFALATVVWSQRPTSAKPGDRALIMEDGSLSGWVGGSCAQSAVQREAQRALSEGSPRLVRLAPEAPAEAEGRIDQGVVTYPMTCHSGGTLEIFIEPFTPIPRLVVIGDSPVALALADLAPGVGFAVSAYPEPADVGLSMDGVSDTWTVIASMSGDDDLTAESALSSGESQVFLVASRKRAESIVAALRSRGLSEHGIARLHAPAGLDIGAATGPEIALSILAQVVQMRRRVRAATVGSQPSAPLPALTAIDPVCLMEVEVASARWISSYAGRTFYFCAPGCKRRFERDPSAFQAAVGSPIQP